VNGGFGDVDDDWAAWAGSHAGWFDYGLDAVAETCRQRQRFTTCDVWRAWPDATHPTPRNRIAEVMDEAVRLGWVRRLRPVGGHTRFDGHAGFGAEYETVSAPPR
jgi:hypothetical protein